MSKRKNLPAAVDGLPRETRAYEFELRADDREEGHVIEGRAIVFGQETDIGGFFAEVIDRGALDNTDLRDVRMLINHNTDMVPVARSRNNNANSTMQLMPDDEGMMIRARLDTENNADSAALYSAAGRGDISGMSFMFRVNKAEWENLDSDYPTRHIKEISKIFEVSAVTFPAYEGTSLNARDSRALESGAATLESARAEARKEKAKRLALKMKMMEEN